MALSDKVAKALDKLGEHQPDLRDKDAAPDQNLLVGTALQEAIAAAGGGGPIAIGDVTGLQDVLDDKLTAMMTAPQDQIAGTTGATPTGTMAAIPDIALSTGDTYTDAAVNLAVNTAVADANQRISELQSKINSLIAALQGAGIVGTP